MKRQKRKCTEKCKPFTAVTECHCSVCHNSFYTVKSFDEHRLDPETPEEEDILCWLPEDCGLTLEKGMWAFPEEHEQRRRVEDRLTKAREARGQHV